MKVPKLLVGDRVYLKRLGYGRHAGKMMFGTVTHHAPTPSGRDFVRLVYDDDGEEDMGNVDTFVRYARLKKTGKKASRHRMRALSHARTKKARHRT